MPREHLRIPGFVIEEQIHESGPRVVYRARRERDGRAVILKTLSAEYPRKQDLAELRREYRLTQRLSGVAGVIQVHSLETHGSGNLAIALEPFGVSLADFMRERGGRPLPLDAFFTIALGIVAIVDGVHQQHVVHKDIVPRNVLIERETKALRLIDFGISSELNRERQSIALPRRLEGSLPYISPEQTGRMNRDLDYRSDYYTLGVTFFELLTGQLPFQAQNALEWVHRHISMKPPSPSALNAEVPAALAAIVLKLMAKNAEHRYQSARGLSADLRRCQRDFAERGRIEAFELGSADVPHTFQIPEHLYGREAELAELKVCFGDVASGLTRVCMVSGPSGVGKSAVVNELSKFVVREHGYLIQGKFDQFQHGTPYSAMATAFQGLIQQLLAESRERLESWRVALVSALGAGAGLIAELVPELSLIIGEPAPVPELPPTEAQNRFQLTFVNFVKVFASAGHPLVIFIDDLQWSDSPTLSLLERLLTARDTSHLFLIGAYRGNQVESGHRLQLVLDEVRKSKRLLELELRPLELGAVVQICMDTLRCDIARARPLAKILFEKTRGNPFFIKALLKGWYERGTIGFDSVAGAWDWDIAAVEQTSVSDNVVDFIVSGLRRLPEKTRQMLELAACIGSRFDLRTLAIIAEMSPDAAAQHLLEALKHDAVVPLSDSYRFVGLSERPSALTEKRGDEPLEGFNPTYRFQHDRVQQAAYALIGVERRRALHLSIGRLMLAHSRAQDLEERLIDVVGHLNEGRGLIDDVEQRRELARANLRAGRKAAAAAAYASALSFLAIGQELLPEDAWQTDYELQLALSWEYQQCCYLTSDYAAADAWSERMLAEVKTPLEKAEVLSQRTRQYATIGRMRESIAAAIAGLRLLGVEISERVDAGVVRAEAARVEENLAGRAIGELIEAERLSDPVQRIAIRLLMEIFPAAFLSGSGDLFPYLVLKSVNISLCHGNSPESAFAYAAYGMLLCGALGDPARGYEYGKLAVEMNERLADIKLKSRVIYVYAMFIHHFSHHWSTMTPWFQRGIEAGYQSGDLLYLAYSAQDCIIWDPQLDLETATREHRKHLAIVRDCEYRDSLDSGTLFLQMQLNFQGLTVAPYSLNDAEFDEARCVQGMLERGFMTGVANFHLYKAEVHYFYGDYGGALEHVLKQEAIIASSMSLPQWVRLTLIAFLTRAALFDAQSATTQAELREAMAQGLEQMSAWAAHCPENFAHLEALMRAERARLFEGMEPAMRSYERAIEAAKASGFRRDEAMSNELAAQYLVQQGLPRAADAYLRAAHYLYYAWGARRKVEQLEARYPALVRRSKRSSDGPASFRTLQSTTAVNDARALDMVSVMKASQAISGEMVAERLWKTTLQILLENAGGQRGCLVVRKNGRLMIEARGEAGVDRPAMTGSVEAEAEGRAPTLPISIINKVLRTQQPVVINDASEIGPFVGDPYLVEQRPESLICVPIRHGQFEAVLYMENAVTRGALTHERVEVIKLLSAQASISSENAQLYEAQLRLTEAQGRFVPSQFLESLGHHDIARVGLGEYVAKEMSVLFCDLRDFTPLAERLSPGQVIELLNHYFSRMGAPISEAGGFVDSYHGDEVMVLFQVAADRAVRAGVGMFRALDDFNRSSLAEDGPALQMGIGLNTGPLVLGTMGAQDRLKCSVVGDTVNLASRIEQLTKRYRAPFLIGERTYRSLAEPERFAIRGVDRVAVKGKQRGVALYEVLDAETPERRAAKESTRALLADGFSCYYARDFTGSRPLFAAAAARDPSDALPSIFLQRAARYEREPPPPSWEGYETLLEK